MQIEPKRMRALNLREPMNQEPMNAVPRKHLPLLVHGHAAFQFLRAGVNSGVYEFLNAQGPASPAEIEAALPVSKHGLRAMLIALVSIGVLHKKNSKIELGDELSALIQSPDWGAFVSFLEFEAKLVYPALADLCDSIKQGKNLGLSRIEGAGADLYQKMRHHPELQKTFYEYMGSWTRIALKQVLKRVAFGGDQQLLDVGGGDGSFSISLAQAYPNLNIQLIELPENASVAQKRISDQCLEKSISVIEGNFFNLTWPKYFDSIIFSHQLVIWSPAQIKILLQNAWESLRTGGRVIIVSSILADDELGPVDAALDTAYFLALPVWGGMIYSYREYETMLRAVGFSSCSRIQIDSWTPHGILIAEK